MATTEAHSEARQHLERLAAVLREREWKANVVDDGGRLAVRVTNPAVPVMTDRILCQRTPAGRWRYTWPWQQPIGAVERVGQAADRITYVLRGEA